MSADLRADFARLRATLARDYPPSSPVRFKRGGCTVEATVLRLAGDQAGLPRLMVRNRKGKVYGITVAGIVAAEGAP